MGNLWWLFTFVTFGLLVGIPLGFFIGLQAANYHAKNHVIGMILIIAALAGGVSGWRGATEVHDYYLGKRLASACINYWSPKNK